MKPLCSIIIRTKNEERWIGPCLNAINRQSYTNYEIIIVDNSEYNLYKIFDELKDIYDITPVMTDVTDRKLFSNIFSIYKPDIVIHAAAYKHVPMIEKNIIQGIRNNIIGTKNCIDLSLEFDVKKLNTNLVIVMNRSFL